MGIAFLRRHVRKAAVTVAALVGSSLFIAPQPSFAAEVPTLSFSNRQNGLCIERSGDNFVLNICDAPNYRQLFTLDAPDEHGIAIRQAGLDICLMQEAPGPAVLAVPCGSGGPQTRWNLIFLGGVYAIQNVYSGQFLDGSNNLLRVRSKANNNNQRWRMFDSGIEV